MELLYKIHITGTLTLETGMHIGGSEVELEIGGIDKAVVKDRSTGLPYIPGSSLKGKLRDLIARKMGFNNITEDIDTVFVLFGDGAKDEHRNEGHLIFHDSFLKDPDKFDMEFGFEEKAENTIDRVTGGAKPRNIERVVRGAGFELDMVLNIFSPFKVRIAGKEKNRNGKLVDIIRDVTDSNYYIKLLETLRLGFRLLEYDYMGGSGTRGYGKVTLEFNPPKKIEFDKNDGTISESDLKFDFNIKIKNNENH